MKKRDFAGFLLTFLWAEISVLVFQKILFPVLDPLFLRLFGSNLSRRGIEIRTGMLTLIAVIGAFLIWRILLDRKLNSGMIIISLALILIMIGIICAGQTLRRDDYWEIHDAHLYGFPGFITYEYLTFNGRYFSLFLKSLYPFVDPIVYINTLLFINILLLCTAFFYLMKLLCPDSSALLKASGAVCMALGVVLMSPNVWEVWFWGGGTLIYGIGITAAVWSVVLMLRLALSSVHRYFIMSAAAVCIFLACGTSELITASLCLFSFMIVLVPCVLRKQKPNPQNTFLFIFTWVITAMILLTSGDLADAAQLSNASAGKSAFVSRHLFDTIQYTFDTLVRYFYSRIEYAAVLSAVAMLVGLCSPSPRLSGKALFAAVCVLLFGAVGSLFINALIGFMPARVISIPLDWVFIGIALIMLRIGSYIQERICSPDVICVAAGIAALSMVSLSAHFYLTNIGQILDIRTAWMARNETLSAMNGSEEPVETCAIPVMGSSQADPSDDPSRDFNIVTAYYYGFPSVTADHLCPPFE